MSTRWSASRPKGYVLIEEKRKSWPAVFRTWPRPINVRLLEDFPLTDGKNSWWPSVQVVPKANSKLGLLVGTRYIAYRVVKIIIPDWHGGRKVMTGWVNRWGAF